MKTFERRSAMACVLLCLATQSGAATDAPFTIVKHGEQTLAPAVGPTPMAEAEGWSEQAGGETRRLQLVAGEEAEEYFRRMRERLADPEQRATLRAEQRTSLRQEYFDAGQALGLDEATERALFELLTDQRMSLLEQQRPPFDALGQAENATRHMDAVSKLLGEEGAERFLDYVETLSERRRVGQFSARLAASDKLSRDQEELLIGLLQERKRQTIESVHRSRWLVRRWDEVSSPSPEQLQRESQLDSIASNEETLRRMRVADREMASKASAFLTPSQLAELSKYFAKEQATLRGTIESARVQAGLDAKTPEQASAADDPKQPRVAAGVQLQVEIELKVNRAEPTLVTQIVRNGESFTFETADGLIAEATPTLYEDDWLDLMLTFYEQRLSGKRRLQGGGFGMHTKLRDGTPNGGGGGGTVITGRKGYAIETRINATAL